MKSLGLKEKIAAFMQFKHLPLIYILKDKHSRIQFITELAAQHTGAQSSDELINRSSADFNSEAADFAADFVHYEQMSMYQRSETLLLSLIHSVKGAQISLICNKPIINDKNEVEGVETWAQVLPSTTSINKIIHGYQQLGENAIHPSVPSIILTQREQECIYYLTRGFTFFEIGQYLNISPRTVETHISNIKVKLNVKTRSELIAKVCELGYLEINALNPNLQAGKLQLLEMKPWEPI